MKSDRRDFLKFTGLGWLGFLGAGLFSSCTSNNRESELDHIRRQVNRQYSQTFNMSGYAAPALDTVRVGVTGLGNRGSGTVVRLASLEGVEITALNDLEPDRVASAEESIDSDLHNPVGYSEGEDDWRRMCEQEDIDLIAIATPWDLHAEQTIYAMEQGKHVYVELPAAQTIEECWQLVETSERTRKHCVQMSSSCHYGDQAYVLNMVRNGLFGEIIHGEGAYIHDLMDDYNFTKDTYHDLWRLKENIGRNGNLYPQHGLVPVAQMMDLNYGDQMTHMVSMSTNDFMMGNRAEELAAQDDFWEPYAGRDYRGNLNVSIIRTHNGRTIMLQHDVTTPRPRIRFDLISGTEGTFRAGKGIGFNYNDGWIPDQEYDQLFEEYKPEITRRFEELQEQARRESPERGYARVNAMDWRLIDCLRNGLPMEMDVYEAALTSAVIPLSEWSVANGSAPIEVPDFTNGAWRENQRRMDVNISEGGTTRIR